MSPEQQQQARAIAFLATTTRPVGATRWDAEGVYAHVARLMERGLSTYEVAARALAHAQDAKAKTPGVIATPPKHTPETNPTRYPPKTADECGAHPGQWAGACAVCLGPKVHDEEPGDRDLHPRHQPDPDAATHVARLRALARGEH